MTMQFMEGFENFEANAWVDKRWDSRTGNATSVDGRHGGKGMASSSISGMALGKSLDEQAEFTVGMWVRTTGTMDTGSGNQAITFRLSSTDQFTLRFVEVAASSTEWRIEVRRGGLAGTVVATQTQAQFQGRWYHIQFKVLAHDTNGTYEVHLDGSQLAELTDSSVDTTGSGSPNIDNVVLTIHQDAEIDDVFILDDQGSDNNDLLGKVHVEGIRPNADGTTNDGTASGGGDNFDQVDEAGTGSLGADYVEIGNVSDTELYEYQVLSRIAQGTVAAVELVTLLALDTGVGPETWSHRVRSGGMEQIATGQNVTSTTQTAFRDVLETNIAETTAWTVDDINAAEFGGTKVA